MSKAFQAAGCTKFWMLSLKTGGRNPLTRIKQCCSPPVGKRLCAAHGVRDDSRVLD